MAPRAEAKNKNEKKTFPAWVIWLCRIVVGAVFIISGWAKTVDPSGFIIKVGEYLAAWNWDVPHEAIVVGCIGLSAVEFATGVLVCTGCLKRVAVWFAAAMMAFMLPLTLYIALFNPVSDCGCFGDLYVIPNWATFFKNVVLAALVVVLLIDNRKVSGFYPAPVQWLVATAVMGFALVVSFIGYNIQPIVDFRPYKLGTTIFHPDTTDSDDPIFVYERDGERGEFGLDNLPGEDWTFVEMRGGGVGVADIAVRNEDGDDVSSEIVDDSEPQVWLILPDPGMLFLTRMHYVNDLYRYLEQEGIDFTAVVGRSGEGYRYWMDLVHPRFPIYMAEDTALEQLARGNAALVYTRGGTIIWKRTLNSMPDDLLSRGTDEGQDNVLDTIEPIDDGGETMTLVAVLMAVLIVLYLLGQSPRLLKAISFHRPEKTNEGEESDEKICKSEQ